MVDKPPPSITFFSNTPGHRKGVTLGNGQLAINQADGVLETQTASGVPRETPLDLTAGAISFIGVGTLGAGTVQSALAEVGQRLADKLPTTTDEMAEGDTSLYFTQARARGSISATSPLTYNSATGVLGAPTIVSAFTNDAAYLNQAGARTAISVTGSLAYNSTTGVISYTAPAAAAPSDVRAGLNTTRFVTSAALVGAAAFVTDSWAATYAPDFSTGFNRSVTAGGNTTFAQVTGFEGTPVIVLFVQGTGGQTIAFSTTYWKFPGGSVPTASTTVGAVDRLTGILRTRSGTLVCEVFGYDKDIK